MRKWSLGLMKIPKLVVLIEEPGVAIHLPWKSKDGGRWHAQV